MLKIQPEKKKLIFMDIDGTILMRGEYIPESAIEALQQAGRNGHRLFIASGRSRSSIPDIVRRIGFHGIIASAGVYVEYEGKQIAHKPMEREGLKELNDYLMQRQVAVLFETNERCYTTEKGLEEFERHTQKPNVSNRKMLKEFMNSFQIIENISEIPYVNKLIYFSSAESLEQMERMKQVWMGRYSIVPNSVMPSVGLYSAEISEYGMHKAVGIEAIVQHAAGNREDVIAVGDGWNDLEMIQYAHIGVAMGNGVDGLKEAADLVTGDIDKDGLWQAFHELQLIGSGLL